jgi:hypothetical protein
MQDPFAGTWKLNPEHSRFDPNHRPREATMRWEVTPEGHYLMTSEGRNEKGEPCAERPQTLVPDGTPRPVPDFPGLSVITTRPSPDVVSSVCRREDGSIVGEGSYVVSADGRTLTATTAGFDTQLRRFETQTVWQKQ